MLLPDGSEVVDSLVVITDGDLIAWGTRGDVDVPNDSIGFDLRGKWIEPVLWQAQQPARTESGRSGSPARCVQR